MKYLFYLGHPAHFHNIKNIASGLKAKGHKVLIVARDKDVLLELLSNSEFDFISLPNKKKGRSIFNLILFILEREFQIFKICRTEKPSLLIGTDLVITHIGKLLGIPSIIVNEDDADVVPLLVKYGYRFASFILAPECCSVGNYEHKKISYPGYQELAYLHPAVFKPDRNKVSSLFNPNRPYYILRFAELNAHHDIGKTGINYDLSLKIIAILKTTGDVYITSERELEGDLEQYRIHIPAHEIHHALSFASLYIGDSQTMAAEAAILGTPAIRYNDFVGEISYLEELEKSGLAFGFKTNQKAELLQKIQDLSNRKNLKEEWGIKRSKHIEICCNVNQFWLWLFDTYPTSVKSCRNNPNFAHQF